jgi:hypothetical protein
MPHRRTPARRAPKKRTPQKPTRHTQKRKPTRHTPSKRTSKRIAKPAIVPKHNVTVKMEKTHMSKPNAYPVSNPNKQPRHVNMERHFFGIQPVDLSQLDPIPIVTPFMRQSDDLPQPQLEVQPESNTEPIPTQPFLELDMSPEYQELTMVELTMIQNFLKEVDFIFNKLPESVLNTILNKIKKIQVMAIIQNKFKLNKDDLQLVNKIHIDGGIFKYFKFTLNDYKTESGVGKSVSINELYLFARLISYVKTLSKLTGLTIDYKQVSGDIFTQYFNMYKNKPISEEAKTQSTTIMEHVSCEAKKQTVYHFYLTRDNKLVQEEHQPILENNNPNISYNVVFIKLTKNGYEPINITCDYDTDTVLVMSSIGYTKEEFYLVKNVMKEIDKSIIRKESTILLHDTEEWVLGDRDFPHMRKVVNCYNEEFVQKLKSTQNLDVMEKERDNLSNDIQRKKANKEDSTKEDEALLKVEQKITKAKDVLTDNRLYNLIFLSKGSTLDARKNVFGSSLYSYHYLPTQRAYSHFVTDTWWYKYFNRTLPCARGRVVQFSGTSS